MKKKKKIITHRKGGVVMGVSLQNKCERLRVHALAMRALRDRLVEQ